MKIPVSNSVIDLLIIITRYTSLIVNILQTLSPLKFMRNTEVSQITLSTMATTLQVCWKLRKFGITPEEDKDTPNETSPLLACALLKQVTPSQYDACQSSYRSLVCEFSDRELEDSWIDLPPSSYC